MFTKTERISYRCKWRTECLRTLCGFANAWGGTLYIGVNPKGEVTGLSQEYCEFVLREIPDTIRGALHIIPEITVLEEEGLRYIAIRVGLSFVPVAYNGVCYMRRKVRRKIITQAMSDREVEEILLGRGAATWDAVTGPLWRDRDLDSGAIKAYRLAAERKDKTDLGDIEYLESLHLKKGERYTRAAALMFTEHPEYWIREAYIKAGFFDEDGSVLYQEKVTGPIYRQSWEALQVILSRYMRLYKKVLPFPVKAVEEALLNAVVHKDYSAEDPIQVRVTKDSVRIMNRGGLPGSWNTAALADVHVAEPRNRLIAELFSRAGYAGGWGMGIEKMRTACEKAGLPAPRYSVSSFGFSVEFNLGEAGGVS
ncbi:MAG: putative DNA binding domain-containing protein [Clostridia bacterium]|nr:putative DNA binding domain-containing protein [Clostridia bacterium]